MDSRGEKPPSGDRDAAADPITREPSAAGSIWGAESMSLPREAAFVALVCMAQFCTRKTTSLPPLCAARVATD